MVGEGAGDFNLLPCRVGPCDPKLLQNAASGLGRSRWRHRRSLTRTRWIFPHSPESSAVG